MELTNDDLYFQLASEDPSVRSEAQQELLNRGFSRSEVNDLVSIYG